MNEHEQAIELLRSLFSNETEGLTPLQLVMKVYEDNADMIVRIDALKRILQND